MNLTQFRICNLFVMIQHGLSYISHINFIKTFAFMCCPFIVPLVIGVSNKAYNDTCGCLVKLVSRDFFSLTAARTFE